MKHLPGLLLLACLLSTTALAQHEGLAKLSRNHTKKGDKAFHHFSYSAALDYYQLAYEEDSSNHYVIMQMAECHRLLNHQENAAIWYSKAFAYDDKVDPVYKLHYAQALLSNEEYNEAATWYQRYAREVEGDGRVPKKINGINNLIAFFEDSAYIQVTPVTTNSATPDFSPAYHDEGIVFVSGRNNDRMVKGVFSWDESEYLDLFYAGITEDEHLKEPQLFDQEINTRFHEGPSAFYANDSKIVFTRNNFYKNKERRSSDNINKLKLFFATKEDDWEKVIPFPYNDDEYSVGHPSITDDGQTLYFASDMPGSLGGTDIFVSYYHNDAWSEPQNMGPEINTEGNEMFPFIDGDVFYFASNGHHGLGGLDIYRTRIRKGKQQGDLLNMGYPINSSKDDFGLITLNNGRDGYLSSNREHELYDDIYHFHSDKLFDNELTGVVQLASTGLPVPNSRVTIVDLATGETLKVLETDGRGRFSTRVESGKTYDLSPSKANYISLGGREVSTPTGQPVVLQLREESLLVKIHAYNEETGEVIKQPMLSLYNQTAELQSIPLRIGADTSVFAIDPAQEYLVYGAKRGYFTNNVRYESGTETAGVLIWKVPLSQIELNKTFRIRNIYYDFDKDNIRPDAARELDYIVQILKENPGITLELGSHTDSRGTDAYNIDLAQRRADSAVRYILTRGIATGRIIAKGYGETQLANHCADAVPCNKEEHQANRRTEFKVIAID